MKEEPALMILTPARALDCTLWGNAVRGGERRDKTTKYGGGKEKCEIILNTSAFTGLLQPL